MSRATPVPASVFQVDALLGRAPPSARLAAVPTFAAAVTAALPYRPSRLKNRVVGRSSPRGDAA
jgi:hypothetical protein